MNTKIIALVIVIVVVAAGIYFVSRPFPKDPAPTKEKPTQIDPVEKKTLPDAEQAYLDFLKWNDTASSTPDALDKRLEELSTSYPSDYRFSLERIRGGANVKGVHSHTEEFEILREAAKKAIACQCGDAIKMRNDLLANKDDKSKGFWKLATHPKQWNVVIEAIEKEDVSLLDKNEEHHH